MKFSTNAVKNALQGGGFLVKKLPVFVVACVFSLLHSPLFAKDFINAGRINNISFGIWSNSGDWSTTVSHCVLSATTNGNPKGGDSTVYYNAKVNNRNANDGLYLYLNGDGTATGDQRISVSFEHRDLLEPIGYETLNNDQYDGHSHNGQFRGCAFGDNSELRISVSAGELSTKVNGAYLGQFDFYAQNTAGNSLISFDVDISVQRSTEVRISNLDPVNFGQHSGVGNLLADERFCVYSSTASGAYRLSVNAANQDAGGNFYLAETLSGALIPMSVRFSDSGTGTASNPMLSNFFSGIGDNTSSDCGGSNNATLSLFMSEADLQGASTGNYGETLIILVEPE